MNPQAWLPLRRYLGVQARVDAIFDRARKRHPRLADLAYANPYDGPTAATREALRVALDLEHPLHLQYTPYGGRAPARRAAALRLREIHGLPYQWGDVVLTPGAMAALAVTFRCLAERPDARLLVVTPCWLDYPIYLENLGVTPVLVPMRRPEHDLDLEAIEVALSDERVVGLILSQPSNPTGVLFSEASLGRLGQLLGARQQPTTLISDEAHRDYVFPPDILRSPAAFHDRSVTIYSFGKALLMQGQRIGYAAVSPRHPEREAMAELLRDACRFMGVCTPTALMQHALPTLARLRPELDGFRRRREAIVDVLTRRGYAVAPGRHTFFVYAATPGADDFAFIESLAEQGLLTLPGSLFHDPGHFRLAVTGTDEMIEQALSILGR